MTNTDHPPITQFRQNYHFLSNFYPQPVWYEDCLYPDNEHAYQSAKTELHEQYVWIANAPTPGEAKRRGRCATLRPGWNEHLRYTVMESLIVAKFDPTAQPAMTALLAATGDAMLIESNTWHDNTWGVCSCGRCPSGHNLLGWMLMRQRAQVVTYR
jgi:ribA/ribD-fused uncharacterized protein